MPVRHPLALHRVEQAFMPADEDPIRFGFSRCSERRIQNSVKCKNQTPLSPWPSCLHRRRRGRRSAARRSS